MNVNIKMTSYSLYVIVAFGFAALVLSGLAWESHCSLRKQQQKLRDLQDNADEA